MTPPGLMTDRAYRIAMLSESYLPRTSGVVHSLLAVAGELRRQGHRVIIAAPHYPGYTDTDPDVIRFPSLRVSSQPEFPLALPYAPGAWGQLLAQSFDIVHVHGPFLMGAVGMRLARRQGAPVVFTHHTLYDEYVHYAPFVSHRISAPAVRRYVSVYANRCSCVIVPSRAVEARLRRYGVTAPIKVVPTGALDPHLFAGLDPSEIRAAFGIPPDRMLLVTASRLAKEKSVGLILEAFARIVAHLPATLLVVGSGPEEEPLRALARRLRVDGQTVFAGMLPHRRTLECMAAADVFLYASQTETQGLVVVEAMAAGAPVIAVNAGGVPDAVQDGATGFLVPADAGALAERTRVLLDDAGLRRRMSQAARAAGEAFSLPVVTRRLLAVYDSLAPLRRQPQVP